MSDNEVARFMGELLCDYVEETALNALAEQLDVNPPVETEVRNEATGKDSVTVKLLPTGLGLESSSDVTRTASRSSTFRSASAEVRLRLVLDRLLLDDRLRDPFTEHRFAIWFDHEADSTDSAEVAALKRSIAIDPALSGFKKSKRELAATREWVVVEGTWRVGREDDDVLMTLLEAPLANGILRPLPEELKVDAWFRLSPPSGSSTAPSAPARARLSGEAPIRATVFGAVDERAVEDAHLRLQSIAVFDRKSSSPDFEWSQRGKTLRTRVDASRGGLFDRLRGRAG